MSDRGFSTVPNHSLSNATTSHLENLKSCKIPLSGVNYLSQCSVGNLESDQPEQGVDSNSKHLATLFCFVILTKLVWALCDEKLDEASWPEIYNISGIDLIPLTVYLYARNFLFSDKHRELAAAGSLFATALAVILHLVFLSQQENHSQNYEFRIVGIFMLFSFSFRSLPFSRLHLAPPVLMVMFFSCNVFVACDPVTWTTAAETLIRVIEALCIMFFVITDGKIRNGLPQMSEGSSKKNFDSVLPPESCVEKLRAFIRYMPGLMSLMEIDIDAFVHSSDLFAKGENHKIEELVTRLIKKAIDNPNHDFQDWCQLETISIESSPPLILEVFATGWSAEPIDPEDNDPPSKLILFYKDISLQSTVDLLKDQILFSNDTLKAVAHDMRAPLTGILSSLECFPIEEIEACEDQGESREKLFDEIHSQIALMRYSGIYLRSLANDLLDSMQLENGHFKTKDTEFHLMAIIRSSIEIIEMGFQDKNLKIEVVEPPKMDYKIFNDPHRISQVFINLLSNAMKYSRPNSTVVVDVNTELVSDSPIFRVSITDSGKGLTQQEIEHLFLPFSTLQTKEDRSSNPTGIGLGLYVSGKIANAIGTGISAFPEVSGGTTFSFTIHKRTQARKRSSHLLETPKTEKEASQLLSLTSLDERVSNVEIRVTETKLNIHTASVAVCSCPKVLVVDDEEFNLTSFRLMCQKLRVNCDLARSAEEAINRIAERSSNTCCRNYQIVMMDYTLPDMEGTEAVRQVQTQTDFLHQVCPRLIGHSALATEALKREFAEAGAHSFLEKPFTISDLEGQLIPYLT
mmetsp:Transcript_64720/g.74350  ORF Transcript_64720/g.74350 Transcript_64720/m.74350 type:complete len:801 (+) Transcript_64720:448-2850(+)